LARYAARSSDKQLGLLLIEKRYFTQADIIQSIKRHALGAVNQFASWREGTFVFEVDKLAENGRITVPIDLENVIIQIARLQKLDDQLEEEIPSLDVSLKFANRPNVRLADLQLTKDEWRVLNFIKPGNTIRMIATTLGLSDKQIRRVIGSLREAGLVELAQAPRRDTLTAEERQKKRQLVGRLIQHLQGMSAE
jgi:DNA-binding NarL/FixJ family response regulator